MNFSLREKILGLSGAGIVIAAMVLAFVFGHHNNDAPKIDVQTQTTIDSLRVTKPVFEHTKDSIVKVVVYDTAKANAADRSANQSRARAQIAEHRADSLAALAQQHGILDDLWHSAYEARTEEADTLRKTVAQKDTALKEAQAALWSLSVIYSLDTLRRGAEEHVVPRLIKDISKLQQPCTVPGTFGRIPCPSRTVTLVLTAVAIEGLHQAQRSLKP